VCVNSMQRRKDISNDLTEAAYHSGKGYEAISKLFPSVCREKDSQVENIQDSCQSSQDRTSNERPSVRHLKLG